MATELDFIELKYIHTSFVVSNNPTHSGRNVSDSLVKSINIIIILRFHIYFCMWFSIATDILPPKNSKNRLCYSAILTLILKSVNIHLF